MDENVEKLKALLIKTRFVNGQLSRELRRTKEKYNQEIERLETMNQISHDRIYDLMNENQKLRNQIDIVTKDFIKYLRDEFDNLTKEEAEAKLKGGADE
jgi:hypothetical protein